VEVVTAGFQGMWQFLNAFEVFGIPFVYIIAGGIILSSIIYFIKGGGGEK